MIIFIELFNMNYAEAIFCGLQQAILFRKSTVIITILLSRKPSNYKTPSQ